ncbi:unnamed protein product [Rotaria sordida]|uniref:Transposase n=1 Tax=Rotaria sordida TaxID=392033 RepID=A0A819SMA4_9BILA|nr:unnamed protein product [Rotaria sordida]CAF4063729.1 unnamed protein product [Rotaria sordida]
MYWFSHKVNKRRRNREMKRQSIYQLIARHISSSNDNLDDGHNEYCLQEQNINQEKLESTFDKKNDDNYISPASQKVYVEDDNEWNDDEDDDQYEDDSRLLYNGSSITVSSAIRLISKFYLNINLDKQKINGLLRLIKSLLPKPNLLPSTWKTVNKALRNFIPSLTTYLCTDCYKSCDINTNRFKFCVNLNCKTSFKQRRSYELIEIVRFDIRSQIQSIMCRNFDFLNKSHLFPPSDICFGEWYQQQSNTNANKITLLVHTDGAPLIRSSKQSIWPCFASITELPPPIREFQSNIIILALWVSKMKPNVNTFLDQTVNDLSLLIKNGTSIFIDDHEYNIQLGTQLFLSDLPAKSLFCCTTSFNGYSACTFCYSRVRYSSIVLGIWNPKYNKMLYPYSNNDYTARTHDGYLKSAREAVKKSKGHKKVAVDGIKASQWKAKNSRLFVLYVGVPIMANHLPTLLFSHFIIYSLAIKLLHAPQSKEDILLGERLLDYYCRTASNVYDSSIEIFSLHAHLHLGHQVRLHGGLAHTSAFSFESAIRYIKKSAHGSTNVASQIAYWNNLRCTTQMKKFNLVTNSLMDVSEENGNIYNV